VNLSLATTLPEESWTILAHFNGEFKVLHETFPPVGDRQEALERAKVKIMNDERLWERLRGHGLWPVDIRHGWVVPATRAEKLKHLRAKP
jgi:hypothetical protein